MGRDAKLSGDFASNSSANALSHDAADVTTTAGVTSREEAGGESANETKQERLSTVSSASSSVGETF